jgi:membrane peptidoglycan carboxypeptidase
MLRGVRRAFLILLGLVLAYLGTVAVWSLASVKEATSSFPLATQETQLSKRQTEILLKIEDATFFTHPGLSLSSGQGFATISSAVARQAFLYDVPLDGIKGTLQSFYRRVFECCKKIDLGRDMMALILNSNVSKERQLAAYVSTVYMGTSDGMQLRGFAQASTRYFGKPLHQLTDHEFGGLVAMIKAPNYFHPVKNRPAYELRTAKVLAVISGKCTPDGWFDTSFDHCNP